MSYATRQQVSDTENNQDPQNIGAGYRRLADVEQRCVRQPDHPQIQRLDVPRHVDPPGLQRARIVGRGAVNGLAQQRQVGYRSVQFLNMGQRVLSNAEALVQKPPRCAAHAVAGVSLNRQQFILRITQPDLAVIRQAG